MAGPLTWSGEPQFIRLDVPNERQIVGGDGQTFIAQVVVNEDHTDDLMMTEHPISGGAVIHDHAFKRPAELTVRMGWSNAYLYDLNISSGVRQLYEQILNLQASRLPSRVLTGKRIYENMLVASLRTHTDASLEFSFIADITFREAVLTSTSAWTLNNQYNQGALANPDSSFQTINIGQIQLTPANILSNTVPPSMGIPDYYFWLNENRPQADHPDDPQQAVFHPLPSQVMGRINFGETR